VFEGYVIDAELNRLWVAWVEDGVVGFGWIWYKIIVVEELDEM
jgi:hypothetical protein